MKKTPKAPAKTVRKAAAAKPVAKKAKTSAAPKVTAAPKKAAVPKAAPPPKSNQTSKVGWSEAIRNALKEKQSGHGPGGGNVWSGKQRSGSNDPQTLRRGRTD